MSLRPLTAVILAGGRSSRFGRDKLAEPIDGRTLLWHVVDAVGPWATETVVVAAPGAAPSLPEDRPIVLVHDAVAFEGPLAGLFAGVEAAHEPLVLVTGGDMPSLGGDVLESMLAELDAPGIDAVVLEHEGRPQPLPMVVRREPALAASERLVAAGERRLGALHEALVTRVVPEERWRALDPEGRTLRDIDTPADLA